MLRPILSALLRNRAGTLLLAAQVALTLAILCNALFIVHDRLALMTRPTGMDVGDLFVISMDPYGADYDAVSAIDSNLALLRGLPGVMDATPLRSIPLSSGGWDDATRTQPGEDGPMTPVGVYHMDEHGLATLGARLSEGRNFTRAEVEHPAFVSYRPPPVAILSRSAAAKLFPGRDALGKVLYDNGTPVTVIGLVDTLVGSRPHWPGFQEQMILPVVFVDRYPRYLVRSLPGQRDALMQTAVQKLGDAHTGSFVHRAQSLARYADDSYQDDRAMVVVLAVMTALILAVTALGIVGLVSFNVQRRTREIGTRRALGARQRDILAQFVAENWLITSLGTSTGSVLSVLLNLWLVHLYELPVLAWYYIPLGVTCLWLLGLLVVLIPALKASRVPPAVATRSV